jgi:triacylglycerol lipase
MRKPPPVYDARFVIHPETDAEYVHFEHAAANPFQARPAGVPRVNVWWLAEAALLSYWDPQSARPIFAAAGLESDYLAADGGTDCYVAWQEDAVLVAFRGTQPGQWKDILTDAVAAQVPLETGQVHYGFAEAIADIWEKLGPVLQRLSPSRTVWFCGHSLGAALATLAAFQYPETRGVATFGCPRVGNKTFAEVFNGRLAGKAFRYVNDHDVITHVPPEWFLLWGYAHVDLRCFIAPDGTVSGGEPAVPHYFADLFGRPQALLEIVKGLQTGALTIAPDFLLDHMPKAYAIWSWNDYDANG